MSDTKYVNVSIVTFNRLSYTQRCIESFRKSADYPYVITVVDNGSTDGTVEWLQGQKQNRLIKNLILHPENRGVAVAANDGWAAEDCAYYMKLDNDMLIKKQSFLGPMVKVLDDAPKVGAVAYNLEPTSYAVQQIDTMRLRPKNGNLGGCCILIPKRTHERLGFWCEDYGLYGEEDTDYGFRIILAGYLNGYMEDESAVIQMCEDADLDYRKFKDQQRERNWSEQGRFKENMLAYVQGTKPLYVSRRSKP
ncbi:MAG: glycosyltransferase family 2 protein [Acidobacteria bacterium]|nr:glycosyltransferase family 2 protein [Acidobacteriota bacterium]MBI3656484.1 glycosyltransferase family 2 protein [Acidobacteriota bacterium]